MSIRLLDKLMVACPNKHCCSAVIYRNSLEEHLRDWCPGTHLVTSTGQQNVMQPLNSLNYQQKQLQSAQPSSPSPAPQQQQTKIDKQWKQGYANNSTTSNSSIGMNLNEFPNSINNFGTCLAADGRCFMNNGNNMQTKFTNASIGAEKIKLAYHQRSNNHNHNDQQQQHFDTSVWSRQYSKEFPNLFPANPPESTSFRKHQLVSSDQDQMSEWIIFWEKNCM